MLLYLAFSWTIDACALGLDVRQLQLFAQDFGQLVERDVDFHQVAAARIAAGLAAAVLRLAALADRLALFAVALADAAAPLSPKRKWGTSSCGTGMLTRSRPLRPIISPCVTYLRRFLRIRPRTICRKRR